MLAHEVGAKEFGVFEKQPFVFLCERNEIDTDARLRAYIDRRVASLPSSIAAAHDHSLLHELYVFVFSYVRRWPPISADPQVKSQEPQARSLAVDTATELLGDLLASRSDVAADIVDYLGTHVKGVNKDLWQSIWSFVRRRPLHSAEASSRARSSSTPTASSSAGTRTPPVRLRPCDCADRFRAL